jgi:hypothetical protein
MVIFTFLLIYSRIARMIFFGTERVGHMCFICRWGGKKICVRQDASGSNPTKH